MPDAAMLKESEEGGAAWAIRSVWPSQNVTSSAAPTRHRRRRRTFLHAPNRPVTCSKSIKDTHTVYQWVVYIYMYCIYININAYIYLYVALSCRRRLSQSKELRDNAMQLSARDDAAGAGCAGARTGAGASTVLIDDRYWHRVAFFQLVKQFCTQFLPLPLPFLPFCCCFFFFFC